MYFLRRAINTIRPVHRRCSVYGRLCDDVVPHHVPAGELLYRGAAGGRCSQALCVHHDDDA